MAEWRSVLGQQSSEFYGALGHAEVSSVRPIVYLVSGKFDPLLDGLEHLDLEGGEEHGKVGSSGERVTAVEVRRHQVDDGLVVFSDVRFEFVEGAAHVIGRPMVGEEQSK